MTDAPRTDLPRGAAGAPIVVGVDGSSGGRRALAVAMELARDLRAAVEVVTAWTWDTLAETPLDVDASTPAAARQHAEELQTEDVERVRAGVADPPPVSAEVVEGAPGPVLCRAARDARVLVLGSHGHGLLRQAVAGSVSRYALKHAAVPVLLVPVPHPAGAELGEEHEEVSVVGLELPQDRVRTGENPGEPSP